MKKTNSIFRFVVALSLVCLLSPLGAQEEKVTIHFSAGAVGKELKMAEEAAAAWSALTGHEVVVLAPPNSTSDRLALYQQQLAAGSPDVDVYQIDVIWPGLLGQFFIDLKPFVQQAEVAEFFSSNIANNTVDGRLVALPWFTDAGLLYYRTDLLEKYGFDAPPETWQELTDMAAAIQKGERATNPNFWGFVWQGNAYEGLTCDALEWIYSNGGGQIIHPRSGEITINNPLAADILTLAASWVGEISPPGVTNYQEEDARGVFQTGNAAFMRNWPYAYAIGNSEDSPIRGTFGVSVLPRGDGEGTTHAATLGGWQLAVSRYSEHPRIAADFIRYLTTHEEQKRRAVEGGYAPTRPALYDDPDVLAAQPHFGALKLVFVNAVPRPSSIAKTRYNRVSSAFWLAVHSVLQGESSAQSALAELETQLERIKGRRGF